MMLKKNVLSAALFTVIAGLSLSANAAEKNIANVTLSGLISAVTCDIDVNGIPGGTTIDTGIHNTSDFTYTVDDVTGTPVPMAVTLKNCINNSAAGSGYLYISGTTAANGNDNIFIGNSQETGFMVLETGGTSSEKAIKNDGKVSVSVTGYDDQDQDNIKYGSGAYTFNVAMASTVGAPTAGLYTAPIIISYASE